ncbi:MAG TPA: glycosyl hydrolase [Cyclobacteriaceae bacterium]|jgi:mannan endo-1,4-beta-mannosidase|nr:glycosyl hydrolase [Cyclobacteriaceae bacterium]
MKNIVASVLVICFFSTCHAQQLIDKDATKETVALYKNLFALSSKGVMFGHQDDESYGVGWWAQPGRSDVRDIAGSYPAVHGWDLGRIELDSPTDLDSVNFENMHKWIEGVYQRGGINTISWHVNNPVSKKSAWDKTPAVKDILPGGAQHDYFVNQLSKVADFLQACKSNSTPIPIIFRPWHEHNGDWFWWGKRNCTEEEYVQLWRFTVSYLRDTRKLHHLIYASSPDRSRMNMVDAEATYLYGYPGDDYVDILGLDDYMDVGVSKTAEEQQMKTESLAKVLELVSTIGAKKNKIIALTETGQESVVNPTWFTDVLLKAVKSKSTIRVSYAMVWRNANKKHHYASYKGHTSEADFKKFYEDPYTLFEADLKNLYK